MSLHASNLPGPYGVPAHLNAQFYISLIQHGFFKEVLKGLKFKDQKWLQIFCCSNIKKYRA